MRRSFTTTFALGILTIPLLALAGMPSNPIVYEAQKSEPVEVAEEEEPDLPEPVAPAEEEVPAKWSNETGDAIVEHYAEKWRADAEVMKAVIWCESRWNPNAWNRDDPYGGSKGLAQFLQPTFDHYAPLAGIQNPDVWNAHHSIETMAYMHSLGEERQWTCFRILYGS